MSDGFIDVSNFAFTSTKTSGRGVGSTPKIKAIWPKYMARIKENLQKGLEDLEGRYGLGQGEKSIPNPLPNPKASNCWRVYKDNSDTEDESGSALDDDIEVNLKVGTQKAKVFPVMKNEEGLELSDGTFFVCSPKDAHALIKQMQKQIEGLEKNSDMGKVLHEQMKEQSQPPKMKNALKNGLPWTEHRFDDEADVWVKV